MSILTLELPDDVAEALERIPEGERNHFAVSTLRDGLRSYRLDAEKTPETPEPELSVSEAAEFLGVTRAYLLTLLASGQIASRQEGFALFIRADALARYRDENKSSSFAT